MRKKDAIELGITGVLAILLLVSGISLAGKMNARSGGRKPVVKTSATALSKTKKTVPGREISRKKVNADKFFVRFSMVAGTLPLERDLFSVDQPRSQDPRTNLVLSGILWNEKKPVAIIDQDFLGEGDTIDRYKVVKITQTKAVLTDGESEFELFLNQNASLRMGET